MCIKINHLFLLNSFMSRMLQFSDVADSEGWSQATVSGLVWDVAALYNLQKCSMETCMSLWGILFFKPHSRTLPRSAAVEPIYISRSCGMSCVEAWIHWPHASKLFRGALASTIGWHPLQPTCLLNLALTPSWGSHMHSVHFLAWHSSFDSDFAMVRAQ